MNYLIQVCRGVFVLLIMISSTSYAQEIKGRIQDKEGNPISFATVKVLEKNIGAITNENGQFSIDGLPLPATYTFEVASLGYLTTTSKKKVTSNSLLKFVLKEDVNQLQEVQVTGESQAQQHQNAGYEISTINTDQLLNQSTDINQILKTTSGINIRETGGLGSGFSLSLNGLTGNQVRYYIDGVPMESYGSALTLNNYPVNLIEDIEIYKGVVPINFGADALGGLINIKTPNIHSTYLDASYSVGSFNTHRLALNGQFSDQEKGYFVSVQSFFNHSDNDYLMKKAPLYDDLGNAKGDIEARRFNDQYTSGMITAKTGVFNKSYADELTLSLTYAENKNNIQHPPNTINVVFGHLHERSKTMLANARYKKAFGKLNVDAFINGGLIQNSAIDTVGKIYRWDGSSVDRDPSTGKGEYYPQKSLLVIDDKVVRSNINLSYDLNDNHTFAVNAGQNYLQRVGDDKVNPNNKTFRSPNHINKTTLGAAWLAKTNNEKFEFSLFAKQYLYNGQIVIQDYENNDVTTDIENGGTGFGGTFTYNVNDNFRLKTSYEKAFRIPEAAELLGDGIFILPNPILEPEKSHNANIGLSYDNQFSLWYFKANSNLFYRNSEDFIRFRPMGPQGTYENISNVRSMGMELGLYSEYNRKFFISTNFTYQDITDQTALDEGLPNVNYQSKVPNIPYLFGNLSLGYNIVQTSNKKLTTSWTSKYVHQFFLNWESSGDPAEKLTIPTQLTHDLNIEYSFERGKYNTTLTVSNITDAEVYDNFKIQKPGRAFYLKFRYYFNR
ncbi:TonB-dependent receptor [Flammeovirga yaeyamensis]|uniref:TonB-dependent receptor n=1 Tax=Flammeovirga yaeyamensis TaxID=367791 RepID=A0AAX1N1L4_9BACT|nr:TonB-dependent receptor [Flammeovirga yaeyamensis]MBB3698220.1 outer membrane cobalamin receptor [Flammeovirga yaeyamensis]NMF34425.1 TonB-dependent receptor [Flammeovirga yaeyamensis]QWG01404.1 TonB-dependent receptor [Flammeovirga yaeyamensis]